MLRGVCGHGWDPSVNAGLLWRLVGALSGEVLSTGWVGDVGGGVGVVAVMGEGAVRLGVVGGWGWSVGWLADW
jgi:hypothetical protein